MKKTFARLQLLTALTYEYETAEQNARWQRNLELSGVADGYTYAGEEEYETADFACDEMEFADVKVYDFIGSINEDERFYERDCVAFKNKADGSYYILYRDDLGEF